MKTLEELRGEIWKDGALDVGKLCAFCDRLESEIERLKAQQMSEDFIAVEEFRQQQRRDLFTQVALRTIHLSTTTGEYCWEYLSTFNITAQILDAAEEFKKKG